MIEVPLYPVWFDHQVEKYMILEFRVGVFIQHISTHL